MKRSIKFVLCLLLTLSLFIPNTVVFAADLDDHNSNNSNKVNLEVINADLTESIAVIEEELGENGTNVEAELNKLIQEFENTMNEKTDTEEIEKLQQLIATTNELLNVLLIN
jgi:peptidoglycan hydrolase CwlO-like protein